MNRIGKWLRKQRTDKGWSQENVANETGLSSFTISTAEKGRVSLITLQKLCELYGASLEDAKRLHTEDLKSPPGDAPAEEEPASEPEADDAEPEESGTSEDQNDSEDPDPPEKDPEIGDVLEEIKNTLLWVDGLSKYGRTDVYCRMNVAGARLELQYHTLSDK
ncbi:helix-turn-helix transcriptional regulator [Pyramidobacter piscolens]|uniref:helix-turn-helix transcriptional regulator n=1 Tax=Pyramidobacter piscolens TaxID=638849 RepID=UPI00248FEC0F|nr:helix-turn-helix transcriptional regulator [Pyramidobacter piscolens]